MRGIRLLATCALVAVLPPGGLPISSETPDLPELTATAWAIYDVDAGINLAELNADDERPMASVTKIMTALVVRDEVELDERVRITESAAATGEAEIGIAPGELWTVEDLLKAVLVRSGNDAAVALAEYVGGSVEGFADLMNAKAEELGLEGSHFVNPHGLDADGHYTTANDLVKMAVAAIEDPVLARMGRTKLVKFKPDPAGIDRIARSTNKLLGVYPGVVGFKTGFTNKAGLVLVSVMTVGDRTLVGVVMNSEAHFDDSRELLDWGANAVTLRDSLLSPLAVEQGGGSTQSAIRFTVAQQARMETVKPLADGSFAVSDLQASGLAERIEQWLRSQLPVTLGGE
ncbi:MAG: D-alanyl-D-alanine carboxypeptidase [Acidimicrobiia bacterium]|nr:D-alanyl-D-alanine carboxypeptidase [Acidimicrobiia bacterium]